ncbi:hypothetical protein Plhal703r1_c17g0080451 [Plasmopara halstedii]
MSLKIDSIQWEYFELFGHKGDWVDEPWLLARRLGSTSGDTTRVKLVVECLRERHIACHGRHRQNPARQPQPF